MQIPRLLCCLYYITGELVGSWRAGAREGTQWHTGGTGWGSLWCEPRLDSMPPTARPKSVCVCVCVRVCAQSCPTLSDCPWNLPGKNTGVGCCFLLQGTLASPALAGRFFTTTPPGKPKNFFISSKSTNWSGLLMDKLEQRDCATSGIERVFTGLPSWSHG